MISKGLSQMFARLVQLKVLAQCMSLCTLRLGSLLLSITFMTAAPLPGLDVSVAANTVSDIPEWLRKHVGTSDGQIAPVVLERARSHYLRKQAEGKVKNSCYFAMDATRPSTAGKRRLGRRFYIICEAKKSFSAVSSGYGNGRKLRGANFSNGRQCAKNFGNAEGSNLTTGGLYLTAEARDSFKGYYRAGVKKKKPYLRTFLLFDGEGDTANARERAIGGHEALLLRRRCRYKNAKSEHADDEGYVPLGRLVNYSSGRSNGCTTWTPSDAQKILAITKDNPTTLYIYPESGDINAVRKALKGGRLKKGSKLYWNASCLRAIKSPKFWSKKTLQPIINKWRQSLPKFTHRPLRICK